jgi:YhcH/YjgK/YiaL family protein
MIVDRLGNRSVDAHLPPRVRQALEFLRTTNMTAMKIGRHEIDGDRLFALVQEYTTKPAAECAWEAHRRYIDVQYVVSGIERMGHAPISRMTIRTPYDAERDVTLFERGDHFVTLNAGSFAIFGPDDVHSPCVTASEPSRVRKIVVKAAIG